jgi:hypothetical protein
VIQAVLAVLSNVEIFSAFVVQITGETPLSQSVRR